MKTFICFCLLLTCIPLRAQDLQIALETLNRSELPDLLIAQGLIAAEDTPGDFTRAWNAYRAHRHQIANSPSPDLLSRLQQLFDHFHDLRIQGLSAGGAFGNRLSYAVSNLLQPVGRDLAYLQMHAGQVEQSLSTAEQTHARALVDWMARTHPTRRLERPAGITGSVGGVAVADLEEIRNIPSQINAPLLIYLACGDNFLAWTVGIGGQITGAIIPDPRPQIDAVLQHLPYLSTAAELGSSTRSGRGLRKLGQKARNPEQLSNALHALYLALFPAPLRSCLNDNERLIIVADDLLHYIPFCALRTGTDEYLIQRTELMYWPSVTGRLLIEDAAHVRSLSRSATSPPLLMGLSEFPASYSLEKRDPNLQISFDPLPAAEEEVIQLAGIIDASPFVGNRATRTHLLQKGSGSSIIHLATHGYLDSQYPEQSFLALNDGLLTAGDLYQFDRGIRAEFVMMSACQTGLGRLHPDSVIGLTNAFLICGANAVGSTLWQIPDAATASLMLSFYRDLAAGRDLATSLRNAQVQALDDPTTSLPFNWAAFKITGRADNPLR
jgi:CHAT domain-containing protein